MTPQERREQTEKEMYSAIFKGIANEAAAKNITFELEFDFRTLYTLFVAVNQIAEEFVNTPAHSMLLSMLGGFKDMLAASDPYLTKILDMIAHEENLKQLPSVTELAVTIFLKENGEQEVSFRRPRDFFHPVALTQDDITDISMREAAGFYYKPITINIGTTSVYCHAYTNKRFLDNNLTWLTVFAPYIRQAYIAHKKDQIPKNYPIRPNEPPRPDDWWNEQILGARPK